AGWRFALFLLVLVGPVLAATVALQLGLMAHTNPPRSALPAICPLLAQLTGWAALVAPGAAGAASAAAGVSNAAPASTAAAGRHLRDTTDSRMASPQSSTFRTHGLSRSQNQHNEYRNREGLFARHLELQGLLERESDPADRRRTLVWLTLAGHEALRRDREVLSVDRLATALAGLPDGQADALITGLRALVDQAVPTHRDQGETS
ncbi:MAG: MarR family winged helix-turn-helix transcriptional regulator, partial [Streptosporangiaceae bacterium]